MAYTVNRYDATLLVSLADETLDTGNSSLSLIGRNYDSFGEVLNENFVHLLENFRNTSSPSNPIEGQLWYDSTGAGTLKVYNGATWDSVGVQADPILIGDGSITAPSYSFTSDSASGLFRSATNEIAIAPSGVTPGLVIDGYTDFDANTNVAEIVFRGQSSTAVNRDYATIDATIIDNTNTSEDAEINFRAIIAGSDTTLLTLNSTGIQFVQDQFLTDSNSNELLGFTATASAVNYLTITNAATGGAPLISTAGTDANIDLELSSKANGSVRIVTENGITSWPEIYGGTSFNASPENLGLLFVGLTSTSAEERYGRILIQIDDNTNTAEYSTTSLGWLDNGGVGRMEFRGGSGTGSFQQEFSTGGTTTPLHFLGGSTPTVTFAIVPVASAVNYVSTTSAITTASPNISATGTDTNIDLTLFGKGTGVVKATDSANEIRDAYRANTADVVLTTTGVWDAMAEVALTDAASVTWDMSSGIDFSLTTTAGVGATRALANPTNTTVGKKGRIRVIQDGSGSKALTFGTNFEFAGGTAVTLTTTANAEDILLYDCISSTRILITAILNIS